MNEEITIDGMLFSMIDIETLPEKTGNASKTCQSGQLAEMILAIEASKRGFSVFFPIGHSQKADLILWNPPDSPISIQVKKATWQKGGSFKFMIGSGKPSCAANPKLYGLRYTPYKKGDFDYLCAYIQERDSFIFYKLDEIAGKSSMRWNPESKTREGNWEALSA
jgi:hypothetical protein